MTVSAGFLIYAALYRLTVLAVGALAIWLGFRLFNKAESKAYDSTGSASAEGGGFKLRLTSILPGTYFALFGTVLIGIMLWRGEPQMLRKEVIETKKQNGSESTYRNEEQYRDPKVSLDAASVSDLDQEWTKLDKPGMISAEAAKPLSNIAKAWKKEGRIGEALAMVRLAYMYGPEIDKAVHLSLLAELLEANGKTQDAADARAELAKLRQKAVGEGE